MKQEAVPALAKETIHDALAPIADAMCAFPAIVDAALWWRLGGGEGVVRRANAQAPIGAGADALARIVELLDRPSPMDSAFALSPAEAAALGSGAPLDPRICVFARVGTDQDSHLRALAFAAAAPDDASALSAVELGWRAAAAALAAAQKEQARQFWRDRAIKEADRTARSRGEGAAAHKRSRSEIAVLEAQLAEQRARAGRLALRMFSVVDEERARIARDLHDDHAQLLAAAQVALEKGGAEGRDIFRRAADELRRSIRALSGAALGETDLEHALRSQFRLLAEAGIEPKLTLGPGAKRLSRSAQQLCWHVAREALANVIRHSHAAHVEVTILRQAAGAVISITDDGRGIAAKNGRDRAGLDGLGERLRLMGGKITLHSAPGATRVIAEIPELA